MNPDVRATSWVRELDRMQERARLQAAHLDLRREERARYSLHAALESLTLGRVRGGTFETEVSQELARTQPTSTGNSMVIPYWALAQRDVSVAASGGSSLIEAPVLIDSLADMLRGQSIVATLPITTIPNAVGSFTIPRETAAPTAYVLPNETTQITESQPTLTNVAFAPKTVGAYTEFSRQLLLQAGPGADAFVRRTLKKTVAAKVDQLALVGSGGGGEPTGVINTAGINTVSGTSLAESGIREFETDVGDALGPDCGWATTRTVASLLNGRQQFTGSSTTLWTGNLWQGVVGGFPSYTTPNLSSGHLLFGAWSNLVLATWGVGLEVATNPTADFRAGIIGVRCMVSFDVGVLRPSAFALATSVT
jgi:HK97 family phage major capsid protein